MVRHLIIYGHGAGDPGAVGNGETERDLNRKKLHPYIVKWANKSKHTFVFYDITGNKDMFQDTANGFGMYSIKANQHASVTEIHEDAASASATGGHVIISSSFKADKQDLDLAKAIQKLVGLWGGVSKTNGISYRNNLLNLNVAAQRGIPYRLLELGFITSKRDMDIIKRELDQYAKEIVEAITGENLGGIQMTVKNTKKHWVVTGYYTEGYAANTKIKAYLDKNKMGYRTKKDGKKVTYIVGWFGQSSSWKRQLEDFLVANNFSYDLVAKEPK